MSSTKMRRYISVFAKSDDRYLENLEFIEPPSTELLRMILDVPEEQNPMYDEYPINATVARKLAPLIHGTFNLASYDYFLSCDTLG